MQLLIWRSLLLLFFVVMDKILVCLLVQKSIVVTGLAGVFDIDVIQGPILLSILRNVVLLKIA